MKNLDMKMTVLRSLILCAGISGAIYLAGCSTNVTPSQSGLKEVTTGAVKLHPGLEPERELVPEDGYKFDAMPAVSDGCLHAWRTAIAGNEKKAMAELKDLIKKYPGTSTIYFMMGQVEDKFGKKKEAVKYYQDAIGNSKFNAIYLFKLAESLRTGGDAKAAIEKYREMLKLSANFAPAHLGLAKALFVLDPHSSEALDHIKLVLDQEPENPEANKIFSEALARKN
jgi:tetratricopeptide (TPR) repeat protein